MAASSSEQLGIQRRTTQRELLLEIIRGADGHLDADELCWQARQRQPGLSLSTVYRSLRLFKEMCLVEEHQLHGDRCHYENTPETGHHHLVCLGCGRVIEFSCPLTESLKDRFTREQGFEVTEAKVCLAGYCAECRKRVAGSKAATACRSGERG